MKKDILGKVCAILAFLLLLPLIGCGSSPTAPDLPQAELPEVYSRNRDDLQSKAMAWWQEQEACLGSPDVSIYHFPVDVVPSSFDCGGVEAAGCMRFSRIEVMELYLEAALTHEYIHLILWKQGKDYNHGTPGFLKCDQRNGAVGATWCPIARTWRLE